MDLLIQFRRAVCEFMFDVLDKFLHVALHLFHSLPHVKYDLDTRQRPGMTLVACLARSLRA
jgi:hypothetical protein